MNKAVSPSRVRPVLSERRHKRDQRIAIGPTSPAPDLAQYQHGAGWHEFAPVIGFTGLRGHRAGQWAVSVSGNWRLVFEFEDEDATNVDLVDYH